MDKLAFVPSSAEEAYADFVDEGAEGLTKIQALDALVNMGQNPVPEHFDDLLGKIEKTGEDLLTVEDLKKLNDILGDPAETLREAFRHFDKNKDGRLTREELEEILKENCEQLFLQGDTDNDGTISVNEFIAMVLNQKGFRQHVEQMIASNDL